jgi:hypothetical protein
MFNTLFKDEDKVCLAVSDGRKIIIREMSTCTPTKFVRYLDLNKAFFEKDRPKHLLRYSFKFHKDDCRLMILSHSMTTFTRALPTDSFSAQIKKSYRDELTQTLIDWKFPNQPALTAMVEELEIPALP